MVLHILTRFLHVILLFTAYAEACPDGYDVYKNICIPHSDEAPEEGDITLWIVGGTCLGFAVFLIVICLIVLSLGNLEKMTIILGIVVYALLLLAENTLAIRNITEDAYAEANMNITVCPDGYEVYKNICIPHSDAAPEDIVFILWIVGGTFLGYAVLLFSIWWIVQKCRKRGQQNEKITDIEMALVQ